MSNSNFENVQGQNDYRNRSNGYRNNLRGKFSNNRENSGFRIRLSENEMKAVKLIQEQFQLKSIVSVLGFSVRTLSEMLSDDKLKENIAIYAKNNRNSTMRMKSNEVQEKTPNSTTDPFARPEKRSNEIKKEDTLDEK